MKQIILGVDPSLTNTVMHCGNFTKRWGTKDTKKHMANRLYNWIEDFKEALLDLESANRYVLHDKRKYAFIEGYSFGKGAFKKELAGEIGGLLRVALYERGWHIICVPPTTLKKFACGAGNAQKNMVMKEVLRVFKVDSKDDNDADARACEIIGHCFQGAKGYGNVPFTNAHRDAVKKLVIWRGDEE